MNVPDKDRMDAATVTVVGNTFPTENNILKRLNELEPPQGWRVQSMVNHLTNRGMDQIQAEKMALGWGLGLLTMLQTTGFEEALRGIHPGLMSAAVLGMEEGPAADSLDLPDKLSSYPGFNAMIVGIGDFLEGQAPLTERDVDMAVFGASLCIEALVSYAELEQLRGLEPRQ